MTTHGFRNTLPRQARELESSQEYAEVKFHGLEREKNIIFEGFVHIVKKNKLKRCYSSHSLAKIYNQGDKSIT